MKATTMPNITKGSHVYAVTNRGATICGTAIEAWTADECKPVRVKQSNGTIVPVLPDQCSEFEAKARH